MPTLQDDLMTEILNNDKKFIAQRKANFKVFKSKAETNLSPKKFNLSWLPLFYKNLFPTAAGIFGVGLIVFVSLQFFINKPASQNLNNESGQNLLVNKTQSSIADKAMTQSYSNGLKVITDNNKLAESIQETTITGELGESIKFSYDSRTKVVKYTGYAIGSNGCISLKEVKLENNKDKFVLKYSLSKKGEICTQVITQIPVKGEINIELTSQQLESFASIFSIILI